MTQDSPDAPLPEESDRNAGGVDNYIASLHLERSNTRAAVPSTLQRRKTLIKQASDPAADQEALELEIRQVERLASLLGRRQTKFDRKRGRPTVNHDLDATLEGFFEVQDENERVADLLLSGTHSAAVYSLGIDDLGEGIHNPELKHANIRSAPATLIATQFESEYEQVVDPFDRIDEMHLTNSLSGSAEYLPLDTYTSEGTRVSVGGSGPVPELTVDLAGSSSGSTRVARGKAATLAEHDFGADSPISDDGILVGITRSSTWKRQSMMLIEERDMLGPALPQIPDDLDEVDEPENLPGAVVPAVRPTFGDATSLEDAFVTGVYPTDAPSTAAVTDYLDILDFIDTKDDSVIAVPAQVEEDDGHISSDLLANSDTSDIDLSGDDGASSSSSSDSDDQYLAKISHQRMFRVANVVADAPSVDSAQLPAGGSSSTHTQPTVAAPDGMVDSSVGLNSHSTLRRSRRILTKGKSIRRGSVSQRGARVQPVVSTQPAEVSLNVNIPEDNRPLDRAGPSPRWSVAGGVEEQSPASQRLSAPSVYPATHSAIMRTRAAVPSTRPDSLFSAGRSTTPAALVPVAAGPASPSLPAQPPGLARLAEAAHAAALAAQQPGTRAARGLSVSAIGGARHKPLPPVPDRIARTLQAAEAQEATAGSRAPPSLPAKARPKVPQALGGDRLGSRAALAAALERPSSQTLFGIGAARTASQQATPEHMGPIGMHRSATESRVGASPLGLQAWLERTDILVPASSSTGGAVKSPPPPEPAVEGSGVPRQQQQQQQQVHTPRPMTAARKKSMRARSRIVRKVAVPPLPSLETPTLRPVSSNSSIHSSASHEEGPSPPTSPNSQTAAVLSLDEHSRMTTTSATTTAPDDPHHNQSPLLQGEYTYSHEYDSMPALAGPTVLSAPPGCIQDCPLGAPGSELLEPSAPMLLEPTAPELPEQWSMVSPHSYAFPQPMYYQSPTAPQYAYDAVPGMASGHAPMGFVIPTMMMPPQHQMYAMAMPGAMPLPAPSQQYPGVPPKLPPKLPEKPRPLLLGAPGRRPLSVPLSSHPQPHLSTAHAGMAPTTHAPDRTSAPVSNSGTPLTSPMNEYVMVEQDEKARLSAIYNEYQRTEPSREDSARPSRNSSLLAKQPHSPSAPPSLSVNTHAYVSPSAAIPDTALPAPTPAVDPGTEHTGQEILSETEDAALEVRDRERQRETKRKAALFELVDTERSYTNDLRMVVELFLLPIQLLGNRKIVDVIFGDMVKITEMNGKMYIDMITRLGPLACKVDPERASRNRRKKKNAIRPSGVAHLSGPSRSVLQGSSLRSPTSPSVSASASTTMSRRLSNSNADQHRSSRRASVHSYSDAAMSLDNMSISQTASRNGDRASVVSNGDDLSIATSNSGGSGGDPGELRYLASATSAGGAALVAERHDSVRSLGSASEEDENDASKWTEDQVLDYFKNVCIGDVMSNYLKDFSEHYAQYSANHDKAIEYLKLVRESSSRLNLRSDATRDAHQKLLLTLERAEKDTRVRRLRLESFLLSPVQRVMRYPLLLEALLKYTPEDHPDHEDVALALSIAGSVATEVDRKSEELVNRQRLAELQSTFDWAHLLGGVQLKLDTFTKLVGQRKFVRKGPLRKASSGKHLYAILFNDFMMITVSDRRGGVWCYEPYRLPIQTYDLLARDPAKDQFELVNLKNSEVLQLRADTPAEASDWVKDIMKTANHCYDVMCEALTAGIQVSKVKSVISQEAREKILQGGKPTVLSKRY